MVIQSEKRLLWHPRHENRFVVGGGSQITLYEWVAQSSEIKQVTSQLDLTLMKCFAWSPDATFNDLVAVGLSTGRVDLMRLEATKSSRNNVLSSGPSASLPVRSSRSCNALAFCAANPNYLAVGLDKVRTEASLVIWDIHTTTPSLSLDPSVPLASISSSRLNTQITIPKLESSSRTDPRMLQLYSPADMVSSVAFLPSSPNLLIAGISHRWLRLFDLRAPATPPVSVATKVYGVATDPLEPHRIGCFGESVATIWDARRLAQPLLTFTEKDAGSDGARARPGATFATMEFSSTRRGVLATLEKDAYHVRFWDLQQAEVVDAAYRDRTRSRDSSQSSKATRSWTNPSSMLSWSTTPVNATVSAPSEHGAPYNLVLSDTRKTKNFTRPLASFALVPSAKAHPLTSDIMVVNKEGDLGLYAVHDTPKSTPWSARGDLAIGLGCSYRIFPGVRDRERPPEPWDIPVVSSTSGSQAHSLDRHATKEESIGRGRTSHTHRSPHPPFGPSDEDGFPAVPVKTSTNLAATRPGRSRTYSPAALRHLQFEHTSISTREHFRVPESSSSAAPNVADTLSLNGGQPKQKDSRGRHHSNASSQRILSAEMTMRHLVEEDVSMIMLNRVIKGYGIANALHNAVVARDTSPGELALAELWRWIHHGQKLFSVTTARVEGYNFAYQGLSGIWEGFHPSELQACTSTHTTPRVVKRNILPNTPVLASSALPVDTRTGPAARRSSRRRYAPDSSMMEDFLVAISVLNERSGDATSSWQPSASTAKLSQRRLALRLCGWSLAENDLSSAIKRWEKENRHSQAACWLVFTNQSKRAVELLMRSEDESLHMMSGMLTALAPSAFGSGSRNRELIEHCERLVVRMQDPYLRAMLTYLTVGDWSEVLQEEALPLRERLAIAFQFLDDKELSSYLRRVSDRCVHNGDIEGLIVTGLTAAGMEILQTYLDTSGDVQTAAILSSLTHCGAHDVRAVRWLDVYRDLLDSWRLFHHRCQFDIERGRVLQDAIDNAEMPAFEWAPKQVLIRCNYCNKPMDPPFSEAKSPRATACPHCGRPLPRCSVCLMTLSIVPDSVRNAGLAHSESQDTIDEALVFCQTCRHGGHASHILQWFYGEGSQRTHGTCPVAGCDCQCAEGS